MPEQLTPDIELSVVSPLAALQEFETRAATSRMSVLGQSMYLEDGPQTRMLTDSFKAASRRGVPQVQLTIDHFNSLTSEGVNIFMDRSLDLTNTRGLVSATYKHFFKASYYTEQDLQRRRGQYQRNQASPNYLELV